MFGWVLVWIFFAVMVGALANSRGRSGFGFFMLSVVFSPLVGFAAALALPDLELQKLDEKRRHEDHERQLEALKAVTSTARSGGSGASIADEIEKLAQLKERGLLTDDEFAAQKAALLATTQHVSAKGESASA